MTTGPNKIDYKILRLLQQDGRMGNAEIAKRVNVSAATCHRRTQRLPGKPKAVDSTGAQTTREHLFDKRRNHSMQDDTGTSAVDQDDEKAVRDLIEQYARSTREGRLDEIMALYTPDVVAFDAITALQFKGADAYREHWEMCLKFIPPGGEMILEVHDPAVSVGGNIAFVHYLSRCGCIDAEGKKQVGWMRGTVCCRRTAEDWRIAHEHYSSPFDPESMKMLTDLEP